METKENPMHLETHSAAVLSYLVPPVTGVLMFITEKKDKFVKFHAFQSILFGICAYILWTITNALSVMVLFNVLLKPLVSLFIFGTWLILMWKAYNKEEFELPYLGKIAKEQANK